MSLFGSSGIRGVVGELVTPELALKVGMATGSLCKSVVIGHDPRLSGPMLENALCAGLMAAGADVTRVGLVTTPTLAEMAQNYDCGIMITASHNPPQYNGFKFWNPDGSAFFQAQQAHIEKLIGQGLKPVPWDKAGKEYINTFAVERHKDNILKKAGKSSLKVVVDCGCGSACTITPYVLHGMGCQVISLNSQPDGNFPARKPEPTDESLGVLMDTVKSTGADLGIAHDGDADRMMAVDDRGRFVTGDELLAYFTRYEAKKVLVCPVDVSMMVEKANPGVQIIRTRIGDAFVSEEAKKSAADFGAETSGTWIFPLISYCPDGIYAAARLVELVGQHGKLSDAIDALPRFPLKRGAVDFGCENKDCIMAGIKKAVLAQSPKEVSELDGIRAAFSDGWILIRPSGTEPKVRITAEAENAGAMDRLYTLAEKIVSGSVKACRQ